jgi:hypothetical protein
MSAPQHGVAPCRVCRVPTLHERINPMTHGQTYIRCCVCSTVSHFKTPEQERPS